jgi:hypothetical protein
VNLDELASMASTNADHARKARALAAAELNAQASTLNDTVSTFELEVDGVGRGRPVPARRGKPVSYVGA